MLSQEFLEQIGMVKCLTVKNVNDETVFDWSGDYEKCFFHTIKLVKSDSCVQDNFITKS